jgi:hypothetical protein
MDKQNITSPGTDGQVKLSPQEILTRALKGMKDAEFFEDGLSADLGEMGIERNTDAYVRGFEDALEIFERAMQAAFPSPRVEG